MRRATIAQTPRERASARSATRASTAAWVTIADCHRITPCHSTAQPTRCQSSNRRPRRVPARLPRHLRAAHHGRERARDQGRRRSRPSDDARRAVHQGRALSRAHLFRRARAASAAPGRAPRAKASFERISWDEALDTIASRFRRNRRLARRPAGDSPLQLRRHDGTAAIRLDGSALLSQARRVAARSHDLRDGRQGRLRRDDRRIDRHRPRAIRECEADPDLGLEPDRLQPAPLEPRAGSQAPRRQADRDRPVSQPDRREVPRASGAAARNRRRARARHDARPDRRGPARSRLHRPLHAGIRCARRARARVSAGARRGASPGCTEAAIVALARDYGTITPAVIRLNYGMQRHAGGGMAIRTVACLPALVGAWRDAAGGALLSSSGTYPHQHARRSSVRI